MEREREARGHYLGREGSIWILVQESRVSSYATADGTGLSI